MVSHRQRRGPSGNVDEREAPEFPRQSLAASAMIAAPSMHNAFNVAAAAVVGKHLEIWRYRKPSRHRASAILLTFQIQLAGSQHGRAATFDKAVR